MFVRFDGGTECAAAGSKRHLPIDMDTSRTFGTLNTDPCSFWGVLHRDYLVYTGYIRII